MKKIFLFLFLLSNVCYAQPKLSDQAEISVITYGPWQGELYSAFGHSAFRVNDPALGMDEQYDYGVFDFNQPNFYLNFARGYLNYKLAVHDYKPYEAYYISYNRHVHQRVLNLSTEQKQKLFEYLQWNAKPENQYYRYDYFYDNCATKIPDVVRKVFGNDVVFDGSYIKTNFTIRELTDIYLVHQPWGDLGIDICLGLPMDKKATPYQYMFLPDYVQSGFDHATIIRDGNKVPLVKEKINIYDPVAEDIPKSIHPLLVFSLLFMIAVFFSYRDINKTKLTYAFDAVLFTVLGLVGLLLLFLWVATDHKAAAKNFNLLWALPTHLVAVIAFIKNPKWLEKYFLYVTVISILLLLTWAILPQKLNYALIPIVMTSALRSYTQYRVRKQLSQNVYKTEVAE